MAIEMAYNLYTPAESEKRDLPPVILVHCLIETKETWIHIGPMIAKGTGRNVYAVDLRNHGDSPWTDEYGTDILVEDFDHFMIQHQIPTAVVLGHSMGAAVAMRFALKKPEKVEQLIIEDTPSRKAGIVDSHLVAAAYRLFCTGADVTKKYSDKKSATEALMKHYIGMSGALRIPKETFLEINTDTLPFRWNGKYLELKVNVPAIKKCIEERKIASPCSGVYDGKALFLYGTRSYCGVLIDNSIEKHFPRAIKKPFLKDLGHFLHQAYEKEFAEEVIAFINDSSRFQSKY